MDEMGECLARSVALCPCSPTCFPRSPAGYRVQGWELQRELMTRLCLAVVKQELRLYYRLEWVLQRVLVALLRAPIRPPSVGVPAVELLGHEN